MEHTESRDHTVVQWEHSIAAVLFSLSAQADQKEAWLTSKLIDSLRNNWTADLKPDDSESESKMGSCS